MTRFRSLEFGDDSNKDKSSRNIRDEHYFHNQALKAYLNIDFELALREYSRSLERNHTFFPAWLGQVQMLIELGEYDEAVVWADKALEMFPEHPRLFAAKALALLRDAHFQKALALSDNSVSQPKVSASVWLVRAEIMIRKKSRVALSCISKAVIAAENDKPLVELQAGRILTKYKKYSNALEYLSSAVTAFPESALAWYNFGFCQSRLGLGQAKDSLQQAQNLRPDLQLITDEIKRSKKGIIRKIIRR